MFNEIIPFNISHAIPHPFLMCPEEEGDVGKLAIHAQEEVLKNYVFDYYVKFIKQEYEYTAWLRSRKIYDPAMLDHFKIGFADNSIGNSFEHCRRPAGARDRGTLQRLGLLTATGYQFFRQSMVFPFMDADGDIVAAYGRRIADRARNDLQLYLHWNHEAALFFNRQAMRKNKVVILCKSPVEALTFWCAGIRNAVATMGIYSFSDGHLSALEENGIMEVIIALDNTDAGNYVAGMIAQAISAAGICCRRVVLPRNQDVNAFAVSQVDHISALKCAVDAARPFQQTYSNLKLRG
jgi:DNA primase